MSNKLQRTLKKLFAIKGCFQIGRTCWTKIKEIFLIERQRDFSIQKEMQRTKSKNFFECSPNAAFDLEDSIWGKIKKIVFFRRQAAGEDTPSI